MKKFTIDQLMEMDTEELQSIREKMWDVKEIMRVQEGNHFNAYELRDIFRYSVSPILTVGVASFAGIYALKYYMNRKYPITKATDANQEVENV